MDDLTDFALNEEYKHLQSIGDKLAEISSLIAWKPFRPILESMYHVIVMFKMLVLQQWHGLSDAELERQCIDRISFRKFLSFPEYVPDSTTVWSFRKRIIDNGIDEQVWDEMQKQLDALGLKIKKGMIQDATFIHSNPGHAKVDEPRGKDAKTRRSKDGTWTKKGGKSYFGYKFHTIIDKDYELIRRFKTTTASVHDSQIDLSELNEVVYRDRGYFGAIAKGFAATMQRAVRGHPLEISDILRNKRISSQRVPGERVYSVVKEVFNAGKVLLTTVERGNVKMLMTAFCFNLHQLKTLKHKGII